MPTAPPLVVAPSTRASSAQRASCSARRASPAATARPGAGRDALAGLGRDARAHALGDLDELVVGHARAGSRPRARPGWRRATAARRPRAPRPSAASSAGSTTSTETSAPRRNGFEPAGELGALQLAALDARQHVAGQAALGGVGDAAAQQLERDDGAALVQREAVDLGQAAGVLDPRDPRLRRAAAVGGDREDERAAGELGVVGRERLRRRRERARRRASAPIAAICSSSSGRRNERQASGAPRPSSTSAVPPTRPASAPTIPSMPRSASTTRCRRSCAAIERRSSAYSSLTSRVNACSVIAMNGSSYGISISGKPRSRAASTSVSGNAVVREAHAEAQAGEAVVGEALDELALGRGVGERQARREQQLAARQPRRRVRRARRCAPTASGRRARPRPRGSRRRRGPPAAPAR